VEQVPEQFADVPVGLRELHAGCDPHDANGVRFDRLHETPQLSVSFLQRRDVEPGNVPREGNDILRAQLVRFQHGELPGQIEIELQVPEQFRIVRPGNHQQPMQGAQLQPPIAGVLPANHRRMEQVLRRVK